MFPASPTTRCSIEEPSNKAPAFLQKPFLPESLLKKGDTAGARACLNRALAMDRLNEKAQALDRFFVRMPSALPDPRQLGDFFVPGTATLGALADIYGLQVAADHTDVTLADYFNELLRRKPRKGDSVALGPIALLAPDKAAG